MSFQYTSLVPGEIRVLQILQLKRPPEDNNLRLLDALPFRERGADEFARIKTKLNNIAPLECTLNPIPLEGKRCFETISHMWGDLGNEELLVVENDFSC